MSAVGLLAEAHAQGIFLWTEAGSLRVGATRGRVPDELRTALAAEKEELIAHLESRLLRLRRMIAVFEEHCLRWGASERTDKRRRVRAAAAELQDAASKVPGLSDKEQELLAVILAGIPDEAEEGPDSHSRTAGAGEPLADPQDAEPTVEELARWVPASKPDYQQLPEEMLTWLSAFRAPEIPPGRIQVRAGSYLPDPESLERYARALLAEWEHDGARKFLYGALQADILGLWERFGPGVGQAEN